MTEFNIAGTFNTRGFGLATRPWLLRSGSLDGVSAQGEQALRQLGVNAVLDLREADESKARQHRLPVHSLPLFGKTAPNVGNLESVYLSLLQERSRQLAAAVGLIAATPGTTLVHCAIGKDRTGLVVALTLEAVGVAREAIIADYCLSGERVRRLRGIQVEAELAQLGLNADELAQARRLHLDSPPQALACALDFIAASGGANQYLLRNGLSAEALRSLVARARGDN